MEKITVSAAFEAPHACAELRHLHQPSAAPRRGEGAADGGDRREAVGDGGDHRGGHAGLGHLLHLTWKSHEMW